jgi:hypothetical protein
MGLPVRIVALLADGCVFRSDKRVYENKMLGEGFPWLIYDLCFGLHCIVGLLGLLHRRSRVVLFEIVGPTRSEWGVAGPGW